MEKTVHHPMTLSFNPRSPWEERPNGSKATAGCHPSFNPRSPWEERPTYLSLSLHHGCFNPRSPWEERRRSMTGDKNTTVSIHAPRGRSDVGQ